MQTADDSRLPIALTVVMGVLFVSSAVLALVLGLPGGGREVELTTPQSDQAVLSPSPAATDALEREAVPVEEPAREAQDPATSSPVPGTVRCLGRVDRAPIAGISVYVEGVAVAGPSGANGVIVFERRPAQAFALWGAGWRPAFVRAADPTPTEVALGLADAALEVQVLNLGLDQEVERSLVHARAFPAEPGAPWAPVLEPLRTGGLRAERLPPGAYDVYVWLRGPDGTGPALSEQRVLVTSGETTTVSLDAEAATDVEPDG